MGVHDTPRMADTYGVPTFFITDVVQEDAGNGNARIWNCTNRNGILIPQCEIIIHSSKLMGANESLRNFARALYMTDQMATGNGSH